MRQKVTLVTLVLLAGLLLAGCEREETEQQRAARREGPSTAAVQEQTAPFVAAAATRTATPAAPAATPAAPAAAPAAMPAAPAQTPAAEPQSAAPAQAAPAAAAAAQAAATPAVGGSLNLYIWSEYLPEPVIEEFTRRTGVKVNVDNYDSNETLLAKLQSGVAGSDLVVPSDYMIEVLIAEKLIQPVDKSKLSNLKNIEPRFINRPFDPENAYAVPYLWGTTGLGYSKKAIAEPVTSWAPIFDEKYTGKILMLDDVRECFAAALKSMGKSINARDEESLRAAGELLKKQKALVKTYNSDDFDNVLASGDVVLAQGYNGQLAKLAMSRPDEFAYVVPKEGCTVAMDAMCIPTGARNVEAAHLFLNYIHEPQVNAQIVNGVNYASTNAAAKQYVDPKILSDPAIYPADADLAKCEFMEDIGPEATELMDRLWTEIKAE